MNILDLGCGPGLYASEFAMRGHSVTGIDFSAESIRFAEENAVPGLDIRFRNEDYLNEQLGEAEIRSGGDDLHRLRGA